MLYHCDMIHLGVSRMFSVDFLSRDKTTFVNDENVFCCFNPEDGCECFKRISNDVLDFSDALVCYRKDNTETLEKEYYNFFSHISYIIVIVTRKFLEDTASLCRSDLNYAVSCNIPVLPIICEDGLEESFNKQVAHLHTININSDTYRQNLKQFVDSFSKNKNIIENWKNAFQGKVFISYRKKDYDAILPCLRALHQSECFRNIAVWYDSYLHIGENFDDEIQKNLEDSDAIIVIATDNVWNQQPNYVLKQEIPLAERLQKNILYINYNLSPEYAEKINSVKFTDHAGIEHFLSGVFERNEKLTAEQQYILGVSYLQGFYTERNQTYALKYLTSAAQASYKPAIKELVNAYRYGYGVNRSKQTALEYQHNIIDIYRNEFLAKKTIDSGIAFLEELLCYQNIANEFGDSQKGLFANEQAIAYDKEFSSFNNIDISNLLLTIYRKTAITQLNFGLLEDSQTSFLNAERVLGNRTDILGCREKLLNMVENALLMLQRGEIEAGLLRMYNALYGFSQLFEKNKLLSIAQDYNITLSRLCYIILKLESDEIDELPFRASDCFEEFLRISSDVYNKTREHKDLVDFARAYFYLGNWLGRSDDRQEQMKSNGAYNKAYKLMSEDIHNIRAFDEFKFLITILKTIGDSYIVLGELCGATGAYTRAYEITMNLYEKDTNNVWLLQKLSELSECLGDVIGMRCKNGDSAAVNCGYPSDFYDNSMDIEKKVFEITKDRERLILRAKQVRNKFSSL